MRTQTVRTTVDLDIVLAQQLREYAAKCGQTKKEVLREALARYINMGEKKNNADLLWKKMRRLAKMGSKRVDLVAELRKDRNRDGV